MTRTGHASHIASRLYRNFVRESLMQLPSSTAAYLAVLALLYATLSIEVVRLRRKNLAGFGDADNAQLRSAIRAHAHFAEYVPIIALMVMALEISGLPETSI